MYTQFVSISIWFQRHTSCAYDLKRGDLIEYHIRDHPSQGRHRHLLQYYHSGMVWINHCQTVPYVLCHGNMCTGGGVDWVIHPYVIPLVLIYMRYLMNPSLYEVFLTWEVLMFIVLPSHWYNINKPLTTNCFCVFFSINSSIILHFWYRGCVSNDYHVILQVLWVTSSCFTAIKLSIRI